MDNKLMPWLIIQWFLCVIIADEPLLSPDRAWGGVRAWFYFTVIHEREFGLWYILKYHRRPYAQARDDWRKGFFQIVRKAS